MSLEKSPFTFAFLCTTILTLLEDIIKLNLEIN